MEPSVAVNQSVDRRADHGLFSGVGHDAPPWVGSCEGFFLGRPRPRGGLAALDGAPDTSTSSPAICAAWAVFFGRPGPRWRSASSYSEVDAYLFASWKASRS